jgi:hypothetical protein
MQTYACLLIQKNLHVSVYEQNITTERMITMNMNVGNAGMNVLVVDGQIPVSGDSLPKPHCFRAGSLSRECKKCLRC